MNQWPMVRLGTLLRQADRFETKDASQTYRFAGTYSFARGIFVGAEKHGSSFALGKLQRIRAGDFIYCKIMAWEGAFGLAPQEVDGCVMSGAFVVYEVLDHLVRPEYLDYYFKQQDVWKRIGSQSTGTNVRRKSLHPQQFESATIPLPPMSEQDRIVAILNRINELKVAQQEILSDIELLQAASLNRAFRGEL